MAYGLGAGLAQGFVRGYQLAEEGKEREQKLRLQEETATRDRERYQREVADREAAERIQAGLRLLATARTPEELDTVEGIYSGKINWKDIKPGGQKAGIAAPAAGVEAPPPATGVQTFPLGTQPGTPLTYTDEAGTPLATGGPAAAPAPAQAPADNIYIPNHRGDRKLRDRMYSLSEQGYRELALLKNDYKTAAALPALTNELKSKDWDMEAGPLILAASQGSAPAAREVLKMIPGMEGVNVPDNFQVGKDGSLILEKDGKPFNVTPQALYGLAGKFKSPTEMLKTFVEWRRGDVKEEREGKLSDAVIGLRGAQTELATAQAGLADAQAGLATARADRAGEPPTIKPDKLEEIRNKGRVQIQSLIPVKTASEEEMRVWGDEQRASYNFALGSREMAVSIFNSNIDNTGKAVVPADLAVNITRVLKDPARLAAEKSVEMRKKRPDQRKVDEIQKALNSALDARSQFASRVQTDDNGKAFIEINGQKIFVPPPRGR